jgi:nucleoid DNA-binding protein
MRKDDIVDLIWNRSENITREKVAEIVDQFLVAVSESVRNGERVELRRFGTFYRAEVKERKIFSPIAKKLVDVERRFSIKFKESRTEDTSGD